MDPLPSVEDDKKDITAFCNCHAGRSLPRTCSGVPASPSRRKKGDNKKDPPRIRGEPKNSL
jgi:hypothetical protein